jgi:hypothetical protein
VIVESIWHAVTRLFRNWSRHMHLWGLLSDRLEIVDLAR